MIISVTGWCGMQKDCFLFLMDVVPSLREYGNVSYHQSAQQRPSDPETASLSPSNEASSGFSSLSPSSITHGNKKHKTRNVSKAAADNNRTVVPILSIDIPD